LVRSFAEQVRPRFTRQAFDAVEIDYQQVRKLCERKRIERLIARNAGNVAQAAGTLARAIITNAKK
jgi:hypothetical protein